MKPLDALIDDFVDEQQLDRLGRAVATRDSLKIDHGPAEGERESTALWSSGELAKSAS